MVQVEAEVDEHEQDGNDFDMTIKGMSEAVEVQDKEVVREQGSQISLFLGDLVF